MSDLDATTRKAVGMAAMRSRRPEDEEPEMTRENCVHWICRRCGSVDGPLMSDGRCSCSVTDGDAGEVVGLIPADQVQVLADAIDLLREIATSDPVDNARDPDRNRRIARDFILALMEETPE